MSMTLSQCCCCNQDLLLSNLDKVLSCPGTGEVLCATHGSYLQNLTDCRMSGLSLVCAHVAAYSVQEQL